MKILIADDEDYTREGIIENISWQEYGIDEIMQAINGSEARKIATWFHPDIVLTDVRMPKMDGIEFATGFLEKNPDSRVIFMSGYMETEYLKSAIRLSAVDYIEKPIDLELLKKALKKAVKEIQEVTRTKEVVQSNKEAQQQKLFKLLTSKEADFDTIEKIAAQEKFALNQSYLCVIMQLFLEGEDKEAQVWDQLQGFFREWNGSMLGNYNIEERQYELLIAFREKDSYRLEPTLQNILYQIPESRIGVGIEVKDNKGIYNSYRTAKAAINCSFYQEEQRFFKIDEGIMQRSFVDPGIYGEFLHVLAERPDRLPDWFENLFAQLKEKKYYQKEQIYTLMVSLLTAVYQKMPGLYGVLPEIMREDQIYGYINRLKTLSQLREFMHCLLSEFEQQEEGQSAYSRVIRGVKDEVSRHYQDPELSVASIAENLHFNAAYLNVLFKQEMKMTLKQYMSNYRLNMAKKMLEQGYDKITEIAEQCGYANANYFAKVFREATGMSPAEYRKEMCHK